MKMKRKSIDSHLFVVDDRFDVERCFLNRQQIMPIIKRMIKTKKQLITAIPMIMAVEFRLLKSRQRTTFDRHYTKYD